MAIAISIPVAGSIEQIEISDLQSMQEAVGGWIEAVRFPSDPSMVAYCDEEGKLRGKPVNVRATDLLNTNGWRGDFLVGTVLITSATPDGETADLDPDFARMILDRL